MEEINVYELMFEVVEEENIELRRRIEDLEHQNEIIAGYAGFLEQQNKDLVDDYNQLFNIKSRKN